MQQRGNHFDAFVGVEQRIHHQHGQFEHERGQQPDRHHNQPHDDGIAHETELRIAAGWKIPAIVRFVMHPHAA